MGNPSEGVDPRPGCLADHRRQGAPAGHENHVHQDDGEVVDVETLHPRRTPAPRRNIAFAGVGEPRSGAGGVSLQHGQRIGALSCQELRYAAAKAQHAVADIGPQVFRPGAGAVKRRPLAGRLNRLVAHRAEMVGGTRPSLAEPQAAPVGRPNVGDAMGGVGDVRRVTLITDRNP